MSNTTPRSIWKKLDRFPPVLVRLLAKNKDGSAMTDGGICETSQGALGIADVKRLSYLTHWTDVTVHDLMFFSMSCGVDFASREEMRNAARYLKDPKFAHLKTSKQFPAFREMLRIYYDSIK